jgi:3-hydroxyacyl-CoA dehydrogenase
MTEEKLVVVGAGVMGHGIAQVAALAGYATTLTDLDEAALSRALTARSAPRWPAASSARSSRPRPPTLRCCD